MSLDTLESTNAILYIAAENLWVMILHKPPVKADMVAARPSLAAMTKREPKGFPTLTWILPQAGLSMDNETRRAAADVTNEYAKQILTQATLIEGTGFGAATVRAIVAGLDLMTRSACPKKVFGELGPSIAWTLERAGDKSAAARAPAITDALSALRTTLV